MTPFEIDGNIPVQETVQQQQVRARLRHVNDANNEVETGNMDSIQVRDTSNRHNVEQNLKEAARDSTEMAKETCAATAEGGADPMAALYGMGMVNPRRARFDQMKAQTVQDVVYTFARALRNNLVPSPAHTPTAAVMDLIKTEMPAIISDTTASYLHPLVHGILNEPQYIQFSPSDGLTTRFEQDLVRMVGNQSVENLLKQVIGRAIDNGSIPTIQDRATFERKLQAAKRKYESEQTENSPELDYQGERYINMLLQDELSKNVRDAARAQELFRNMSDPTRFNTYYERLVGEHGGDATEASRDVHKLLMYLVHRIYAPVVNANSRKNFNELVQEATIGQGFYQLNPESVFRTLTTRMNRLIEQVGVIDDRFKGEYMQFGADEIIGWSDNEDGGGYMHNGKQVRKSTLSNEMVHAHGFRDFLEGFKIGIEAEHDLIAAGVNWNYLVMTGKTEQNTTFYQQAQQYASQTLKSNRLDELYKLPYNELVHGAKTVLSSYLKKSFAEERFRKRPDLFYSLFSEHDPIQYAALVDMIKSYVVTGQEDGEDIPEWAIRRAILHARTHLSLVNQELLGLASYAHPYIVSGNRPSYLTPALANLEVLRTYSPSEQWQTWDALARGVAFLPKANRQWRKRKWYPKIIKTQGERVFRRSDVLGNMARIGNYYYEDTAEQNITDVNPLGIGGVEVMNGWRMKYAARSWIQDMLLTTGNEDSLSLAHSTDLAEGWKRFENIGVSTLKWYRDELLFGPSNSFLSQDSAAHAKYEAHWKDFFTFLYDRYFADGIGKNCVNFSFVDGQGIEHTYSGAQITSAEQFWRQVIEPVVNRAPRPGRGESIDSSEKRNQKERQSILKDIVDQALMVMSVERLPVDFIMLEDPLRSQNGITFMQELQQRFIITPFQSNPHQNARERDIFSAALNDIIYVQSRARVQANKAITASIKGQKQDQRRRIAAGEAVPESVTTYGHNHADLTSTRSTIAISDIQSQNPNKPSGYYIDADIIREYLSKKYDRLVATEKITREEADVKISKALEVYGEIMDRLAKKPMKHAIERHVETVSVNSDNFFKATHGFQEVPFEEAMIREEMELRGLIPRFPHADYFRSKEYKRKVAKFKPIYAQELKEKFAKERANMKNRFAWAGNEFLSSRASLSPNDTAYPFLQFTAAGDNVVERTLQQIQTQEELKAYLSSSEFVSQMKSIVRNEEGADENMLKSVIKIRNMLKDWYGSDIFDGKALEIVENVINALRIDSDVETPVVGQFRAAKYRRIFEAGEASHELSLYDAVVKTGPRVNFDMDERAAFLERFLVKAQFPKLTPEGGRVWEAYKRNPDDMTLLERMVAPVADFFLGRKEGDIIRNKSKELSAIGAQDRNFSALKDRLLAEGPSIILLIAIALLLFVIYKSAKESFESK
ncbi:hypothetical protein KC726_03740 [Candidatus Woesebacteria bacterium]|nr:hypothetical protein [Candidatus Woesebacteria bacterium]